MNSLDPSHQASSQGLEPEDAEGLPSRQDLTIRRRQLRRRVWERFEFAFFLGLMMTVIVLGITVMASHLLGGQRMSANNYQDEGRDELMVINVEPESVKVPPIDEDEFAVDTSWIETDENAQLQTNPYVTAVTQNPYTYDYEDLDLGTVGSGSSPSPLPTTDEARVGVGPTQPVGAIRSGGRKGDVETVYRFPAIIWGIYSE